MTFSCMKMKVLTPHKLIFHAHFWGDKNHPRFFFFLGGGGGGGGNIGKILCHDFLMFETFWTGGVPCGNH